MCAWQHPSTKRAWLLVLLLLFYSDSFFPSTLLQPSCGTGVGVAAENLQNNDKNTPTTTRRFSFSSTSSSGALPTISSSVLASRWEWCVRNLGDLTTRPVIYGREIHPAFRDLYTRPEAFLLKLAERHAKGDHNWPMPIARFWRPPQHEMMMRQQQRLPLVNMSDDDDDTPPLAPIDEEITNDLGFDATEYEQELLTSGAAAACGFEWLSIEAIKREVFGITSDMVAVGWDGTLGLLESEGGRHFRAGRFPAPPHRERYTATTVTYLGDSLSMRAFNVAVNLLFVRTKSPQSSSAAVNNGTTHAKVDATTDAEDDQNPFTPLPAEKAKKVKSVIERNITFLRKNTSNKHGSSLLPKYHVARIRYVKLLYIQELGGLIEKVLEPYQWRSSFEECVADSTTAPPRGVILPTFGPWDMQWKVNKRPSMPEVGPPYNYEKMREYWMTMMARFVRVTRSAIRRLRTRSLAVDADDGGVVESRTHLLPAHCRPQFVVREQPLTNCHADRFGKAWRQCPSFLRPKLVPFLRRTSSPLLWELQIPVIPIDWMISSNVHLWYGKVWDVLKMPVCTLGDGIHFDNGCLLLEMQMIFNVVVLTHRAQIVQGHPVLDREGDRPLSEETLNGTTRAFSPQNFSNFSDYLKWCVKAHIRAVGRMLPSTAVKNSNHSTAMADDDDHHLFHPDQRSPDQETASPSVMKQFEELVFNDSVPAATRRARRKCDPLYAATNAPLPGEKPPQRGRLIKKNYLGDTRGAGFVIDVHSPPSSSPQKTADGVFTMLPTLSDPSPAPPQERAKPSAPVALHAEGASPLLETPNANSERKSPSFRLPVIQQLLPRKGPLEQADLRSLQMKEVFFSSSAGTNAEASVSSSLRQGLTSVGVWMQGRMDLVLSCVVFGGVVVWLRGRFAS